jgi:hypothetical protein
MVDAEGNEVHMVLLSYWSSQEGSFTPGDELTGLRVLNERANGHSHVDNDREWCQ